MSSYSYASYLASREESAQHRAHIYEFQELFTMICKEQIEEYLNTKIEPMVESAVSKAMSDALARAVSATAIDVNEVVNVVIKDMNKEWHSESLRKFVADNLKAELTDALKNIDVSLIVS